MQRARRRHRPASRAGRPPGRSVLVVSDHGFGPCLGRVHVNRILVDAGVARLPGWSGRLRRRAAQAARSASGSGAQKRGDPGARSASFDLSVAAQFPLRLEADPGLRPASGHGGDGLCELPPHGRARTPASDAPRARSTTPRRPRLRPCAEARHPETGSRSSRRSSRPPRPTASTPPAKATPT